MNSNCEGCAIKAICTIYADVNRHSVYADVLITNCNFRRLNTFQTPDVRNQVNNKIEVTSKTEIDHLTGKFKIDRDKITEVSNQKRKEKEEKVANQRKIEKPKVKLEAKPLILDYTCPGCGGTTFKEDHSFCNNCGKDICSCCATIDSDTKNLLCPDCWESL